MSASSQPRRLGAKDFFSCSPRGLRRGAAWRWWLFPIMGLAAISLASAQEALRSSLAGDAAAEARNHQLQSQLYTFKAGDFRLLVTPSLALDWNENNTVVKTNTEADFILSFRAINF
jgi:hypothetical protein